MATYKASLRLGDGLVPQPPPLGNLILRPGPPSKLRILESP
jgi:hypothetical protein